MPKSTPISDQIKELDRELRVRMRVYPHWIRKGTILQKDADIRLERLSAAIQSLRELQHIKNGKQEKLF